MEVGLGENGQVIGLFTCKVLFNLVKFPKRLSDPHKTSRQVRVE